MLSPASQIRSLQKLIQLGRQLPLATQHYPSRGQTSVQDLYQTSKGKLFLKKASRRNHAECQINTTSGTLAEREFWASRLAARMGLRTPKLWLLDSLTTVQEWLDIPDGRQYATSQGKLDLVGDNVFDCALFDWLTGQVDRHDANYLYDYTRREIILIDSAHAFLKYSGSIPDYLKYFEIGFKSELQIKRETPVFQALQQLGLVQLSKLVPLREVQERAALIRRLEQLKPIRRIQEIISLYRGGSL